MPLIGNLASASSRRQSSECLNAGVERDEWDHVCFGSEADMEQWFTLLQKLRPGPHARRSRALGTDEWKPFPEQTGEASHRPHSVNAQPSLEASDVPVPCDAICHGQLDCLPRAPRVADVRGIHTGKHLPTHNNFLPIGRRTSRGHERQGVRSARYEQIDVGASGRVRLYSARC